MSLFFPDYRFKRIDDIPVAWLVRQKFSVILLDVDNTLATHNSHEVLPEIKKWLEEVKKTGIRLLIISNNTRKRVEPFAKQLGLGYIASAKKPLTSGVLRAKKRLELENEQIAIIGDQVFTDVLCARFSRIKSILVEPMEEESMALFRLKRRFEKRLLRKYKTKETL